MSEALDILSGVRMDDIFCTNAADVPDYTTGSKGSTSEYVLEDKKLDANVNLNPEKAGEVNLKEQKTVGNAVMGYKLDGKPIGEVKPFKGIDLHPAAGISTTVLGVV